MKANKIENPKAFVYKVLVKAFLIIAIICIAVAILDLNGMNFTQYFDFGFFTAESADSARYLLSAIAQAQAAVIALVVTLTLIAVQLASQAYSPRVMDLFKKHPFFWLLLLLYVVSILYDVIILGTVDKEMSYLLEHRISFAILLAGLAFFALFPYTFDVMNHLKPENVAANLANKVNSREFKKDDYYFISLTHMIKRAIKDDDTITACAGIQQIGKIYKKCTKKIKDGQKYDEILNNFLDNLTRIHDIALIKNDQESAIAIVHTVALMSWTTIEKGFVDMRLPDLVRDYLYLEDLCKLYAEKKGFYSARYLVKGYISKIGILSVKKGFGGDDFIGSIRAMPTYAPLHDYRFSLPIIITTVEKDGVNDSIFIETIRPTINDLNESFRKVHYRSYHLACYMCALGIHFVLSKQDTKDLIEILLKMDYTPYSKPIKDYERYVKKGDDMDLFDIPVYAKIPINKEKTEAFQEFKKRFGYALVYDLCNRGVEFIQKEKFQRRDMDDLIKSLSELYDKSREIVKRWVNDYESNLKEDAKLKAFQEFKKQLTFLKEKP